MNVIDINAERWAEVFNENGLAVNISSMGNVKFFTADHDRGATISMEQVVRLARSLTIIYNNEAENDGN